MERNVPALFVADKIRYPVARLEAPAVGGIHVGKCLALQSKGSENRILI